MSIKQDIRDALVDGPKSVRMISALTGHDIESIRNAKGYLQSDGIVRQVAGQKPGAPNILFELMPIKAPPTQISRLTLPAWVPPKVLHRPTYCAPGCVVREKLTGKDLQQ